MRLFLIRHGEAIDESIDPDRPLTERGRRDVAALAAQLNGAGLFPRRVLHSGKTRAAQTAAILVELLRIDPPAAPTEGLKPKDAPGAIVDRAAAWDEDTALVGHLPSLERIARALLGPSAATGEFPAPGAVILERDPAGAWHLLAQFPP